MESDFTDQYCVWAPVHRVLCLVDVVRVRDAAGMHGLPQPFSKLMVIDQVDECCFEPWKGRGKGQDSLHICCTRCGAGSVKPANLVDGLWRAEVVLDHGTKIVFE